MIDISQSRILIVDDTKTNIDVLVQGLSSYYKLNIALDGESALKSLHLNRPDLVLLDIMMPGMDGYEVCKRIKSDPDTSSIPVIFVTAMDEITSKTYGFEVGAVDYITKPFEITEVQARVRTHLELRYMREKLGSKIKEQAKNISDLTNIAKAMSSEHDLLQILEMILNQARQYTRADGGTLYLLTEDRRQLAFHVLHNETLNSFLGGTSQKKITLPNVALHKNGQPNHSNVSAFVALTNQTVNIPDVYQAKGFNFEGTKEFDALMQYRSQSMLVVPMCDHEDQMIGVLQLINARNSAGGVIPFRPEVVDLTEALASQAAVMMTQKQLIDDLKALFESFIKAIATAIEEKSKYTGGHIERVAELTMQIADRINQTATGPFADIYLDPYEMDEIRIAAWLHDTGKITTAEQVVDKAMKLECVFDRIEHIRTRWQTIALAIRLEAEKAKVALGTNPTDRQRSKEIEAKCDQELAELAESLTFIDEINRGGEFMSDDKLERLNQIARTTYEVDGKKINYLTDNELENLSIRKGTLTENERKIMENHATMTMKILENLPWPTKLASVTKIAGAHHEKLDGTGYPLRLKENEISLQSRIMAVSDVFEALSAPDRPYKKPMTLSQALKILGFMVKDKHLDKNIVDLFLQSDLVTEYANRHLKKDQLDI